MASQGEEVRTIAGTGIAVHGNDIDTDRIIPARYMKVVTFDGLGEYAFRDVRFGGDGAATDHPFNTPSYRNAEILLVNKNFGCGSSREHAPQALLRWGIKAIIGESFAEIFAGNCNALGVPAVNVDEPAIRRLMDIVDADPLARIELDLETKQIRCGSETFSVEVAETYRQSLVSGRWDSTAILLSNRPGIDATADRLPYVTGFPA